MTEDMKNFIHTINIIHLKIEEILNLYELLTIKHNDILLQTMNLEKSVIHLYDRVLNSLKNGE